MVRWVVRSAMSIDRRTGLEKKPFVPDIQQFPGSRRQRTHLADILCRRLSRLFQIVVRLQSHPELLGGPQRPRQTQRGIGRNRALAEDNLIYAPRRHADRARERSG